MDYTDVAFSCAAGVGHLLKWLFFGGCGGRRKRVSALLFLVP